MLTRSSIIRIIKIAIVITLAIIIIGYSIFSSLNYAKGPDVTVTNPQPGQAIASSSVLVTGKALRIKNLTLNGTEILINEDGYFERTLIIFPGLNYITINATDQFGRSETTEVRVFGNYTPISQ